MFECIIGSVAGCPSLKIAGRIDGMSAPAVLRPLESLIADGARVLVADLAGVTFISSAGLRVFLQAQKQLRKVDGELILYRISAPALDTLRMSGFTTIFRQAAAPDEIAAALEKEKPAETPGRWEQNGLVLRYIAREVEPGAIETIGNQAKLAMSGYEEADVVAVPSSRFRYGAGLATIGTSYDEYRDLFGEAVLLGGHFFFYPAVRYPAADFMLAGEQEAGSAYRFLHGFGFNGSFSRVAAFHGSDAPVELGALMNALLAIAGVPRIGVVLLAESKGLWGMHLKQTPVREHRPGNGQDIFSAENFPDWINFPIEPSDFGHILAGTGLAVAAAADEIPEMRELVSAGKNFHLHGAVFSREPLSQKIEGFEDELQRILTELTVQRVLHIQGQTRLASGLAGVIPLG